ERHSSAAGAAAEPRNAATPSCGPGLLQRFVSLASHGVLGLSSSTPCFPLVPPVERADSLDASRTYSQTNPRVGSGHGPSFPDGGTRGRRCPFCRTRPVHRSKCLGARFAPNRTPARENRDPPRTKDGRSPSLVRLRRI